MFKDDQVQDDLTRLDDFSELHIIGNYPGHINVDPLFTMKNLIIARTAPFFNEWSKYPSILIFGDSYAAQAVHDGATPLYQKSGENVIRRELLKRNLRTRIAIDSYGGYSICQTGANDLTVALLQAALDTYHTKALLINATHNDPTSATLAQITDPTTGTYATLTAMFDAAYASGVTHVAVTTCRSLMQLTAQNTAANNEKRAAVVSATRQAVSDWNTANGVNLCNILDLHSILGGDVLENYNYRGYLDTFGNATVAPVSIDAMVNAHPSHFGTRALYTAYTQMLIESTPI